MVKIIRIRICTFMFQ